MYSVFLGTWSNEEGSTGDNSLLSPSDVADLVIIMFLLEISLACAAVAAPTAGDPAAALLPVCRPDGLGVNQEQRNCCRYSVGGQESIDETDETELVAERDRFLLPFRSDDGILNVWFRCCCR